MNTRRLFVAVALVIVFTMAGVDSRAYAQDPPPVSITVTEDIGVSDSGDAVPPATIPATESVSVTDQVGVVTPQAILITESIGVSDAVIVVPPVVISVIEQIDVSDTGGVLNAAPIVDAGPNLLVNEGDVTALAASVIVLDPQLTTATIDWGDGSAPDQIIPAADGAISATHIFTGENVYDVVVTVAGLFGDEGSDSTQVETVNLPPVADAGGPYEGDVDDAIVLTAIGNDPGGDPLTYAWDLNNDGAFDDGSSQSVIFSSSTAGMFTVSVRILDDAGDSSSDSAQVEVKTPAAGDAADTPDDVDEDSGSDNSGKVSGRAVIGRLVSMSSTEIVVAAKIGPDFTNVRVHIDSAATEVAVAMDAEAYTTGSKVVVVADRSVLSGEAIALKIRAIPGTAVRKHGRVIVSRPDDGNTVVLVSGEGDSSDSHSVIKDEVGQFKAGDQVVVITNRDDSYRRNEKPRVIAGNNDVKDRLEDFARKKFDDGDTDSSGLIDRLAEKRREQEQARIDKAKRHADEAVRRAAEQADEKAQRATAKNAADPVAIIRKQAVADSENAILECVSQVLGRTVTGKGDLTAEEIERTAPTCLSAIDDDGASCRIPEKRDSGQRDAPPPEILSCIARVLGSVPDRALTGAEQARLKAACSTDEDTGKDDDKSVAEKNAERRSDTAVDARKIAFCKSNPTDSHCSGGSSDTSGGKDGQSGSETDGDRDPDNGSRDDSGTKDEGEGSDSDRSKPDPVPDPSEPVTKPGGK